MKRNQLIRKLSSGSAVLLIWYVMVCVTGCCTSGPPIQPPLLPTAGVGDLSMEGVSGMIKKRSEEFRNLRGTGKVRIQSWKERYRFSEVFVLETPAHFRLETLGFLDQPAVFLTSNADILSLYTKKHNTYYRGVASQENLFKLSGINLSVEDVIQVLAGNPPILAPMNFEWGMYLSDLKSYYLERVSLQRNLVQRIWFDTTYRMISNVQECRLTNGEVLLELQFKDYRTDPGGYPIPASILIDRPLDHTRVEIVYKSFEVNSPLDQTVFQFDPPKDAAIKYIDDATADQLERLAPYKDFQVQDAEEQ